MKYLRHAVASATALAVLAFCASSASAATAPGYEEFDACPGTGVDSSIVLCATSEVTGGHLKMGSKNTPIQDPISLIGSVRSDGSFLVGSFDGGRQQVPGGLTGLSGLDWLSWLFPLSALRVYAESELAGTPSNPLDTARFHLPLKVKLDNVLFTSNCYIGSNSNPIALTLTTETTTPPPPTAPISGTFPELTLDPVLENVARLSDGVLVDNAFAVPAASGCGLLNLGLIDTLVNVQSGLPSPAGANETVQEFDGAVANITNVYPPAGVE